VFAWPLKTFFGTLRKLNGSASFQNFPEVVAQTSENFSKNFLDIHQILAVFVDYDCFDIVLPTTAKEIVPKMKFRKFSN
jgi:hypothetical protein